MDGWFGTGMMSLPAVLAYVDPGAGSLLFQIAVAGLLTTAMMLRSLRTGIMRMLGKLIGCGGTPSSPSLRTADEDPQSNAGRRASGDNKKAA